MEESKLTWKKTTVSIALIFILYYLLIVFLDLEYEFLPWGELKLYKKLADEFVKFRLPYVHFSFEYPPASIIAFSLPRFFTGDIDIYRRIFEIFSLSLTFFTVWLSSVLISSIKLHLSRKSLIIHSMLLIFIPIQLVLGRYDVYPMFITFIALYLYILGIKEKKNIYSHLAYILLIIGGFVKLYPFLILPILLIRDFKKSGRSILIKNLLISLMVCLPFVILMLIGKEGLVFFFDYHSSRGLEIESLYSSILLVASKIGLLRDLSIVYTHASYGLDGKLATLLSNVSFPLFFALYFLLLLFVYKYEKWGKKVYTKLLLYSLIIILLFIITNKVFSTQYILWIFPYIVLLPYLYKGIGRIAVITITFLIQISTVLIYPIFWEAFNKGHLFLSLLLLLRNLLLLLILFITIRKVVRINH